jgi:peroxiredoxin
MKKFFGLIALFALAAGFLLAPKASAEKNSPPKDGHSLLADGLSVGETAPDFKLKNVDGGTVSLAGIKNPDGTAPKGYIVAFTCNTCPYAVMYEDRLIELHNKYAPKGWPVVAIQPNDPGLKPGDSFEEMKIRAKEKAYPFNYLLDDGQKVFPQYGATKTPHIFLLDNARKVRYIGAIDNNPQDADAVTKRYVEDAIAAVEAGKNPDPDFTKAIGCGIKAK